MQVEFYFDFSCPYAYIASTRIEALAAEHNAELIWRPMLLGGVFRGTGLADSPMSQMGPAKARHNARDIHRWAAHFDLSLSMPSGHPMRTVRALRALLTLPIQDWPRFIHAIYAAYWQQGENIAEEATVRACLDRAGVSGLAAERALTGNDEPAIKDELRRRTDEAVSRGVFGAPTMFVQRDGLDQPVMFWGQDRLHMVSAVLAGWTPGAGRPGPAWPTVSAAGESPVGGSAQTRPAIEFWYDFSSPFAYLGATQIERVSAAIGARVAWRPMLLGAVFKQIGMANVPMNTMVPAKRAYIANEFDYWPSYLGVPFKFASRFPQKTVTALRLALLAGERIGPLSLDLFRVIWAEDGNLEDPAVLGAILARHGFDAEAMLARTREPEVKQMLIDNTAEAVAAGVFGAPTMIIEGAGHAAADDGSGDLLIWGQDRLGLVAATLSGDRG
ncbi:MAG: 2-hydroxychromene-2-carboxylate isomerase [Myxococcota bacterium]